MIRLFERLIYRREFSGELALHKVRKHDKPIKAVCFHCFGVLFNWQACWVGVHYSRHHRRLCINVVPCLTFWWCAPGGELP